MNFPYTDISTEKLFHCYCSKVCLPTHLHTEAWEFWKSVMVKWPCQIEGNLLSWFCCVGYVFIAGKQLLHDRDNFQVDKDLNIYKLCQQSSTSFSSFLIKLAEYEMVLLNKRTPCSLVLTKKYLTALLVSEHHDQLCKQLFIESHPTFLENKQFIWLLFLVAKSLNLGNAQGFLQHYCIYICCLSYGISLMDLDALIEPVGKCYCF